MSDTEANILELLKNGWTYAQIQEELQVSSKTIAAVRKAYFSDVESNNTRLSDNLSFTNPEPESYERNNNPEIINPNTNLLKKSNHMSRYNDEDDRSSDNETEKLRIQLAHDLELEKLQAAQQEKDREFDLREQELALKRDELLRAENKIIQEKRDLLYRIGEIVESCEDGEYTQSDLETRLENTNNLFAACKRFCSVHSITFQGSPAQSMLEKVISELTESLQLLEDEENDLIDLEFDPSFKRMAERMDYSSF